MFKFIYRVLHVCIVIKRYAIFSLTRKQIDISFLNLEAPIGVIGLTNKVIWKAENILYTKITFKERTFKTIKSSFTFLNTTENKTIKIEFVSTNQKIHRKLEVDLITINKRNTPDLTFRNNYTNLELQKNGTTYKPVLNNTVQLNYRSLLISNTIHTLKNFSPILLSQNLNQLQLDINSIDSETEYQNLLNQLKNEGIVLPKSASRSYYEIAMESRWL